MKLLKLTIFIFIFSILNSCSKKEPKKTLELYKLKSSFINIQKKLLTNLIDSYSVFSKKSVLFYYTASDYNLIGCKEAWKKAYNDFLCLGAFSHDLAITDVGFEKNILFLDPLMINYEYVDYSITNLKTGIINDSINYPLISRENILSWNLIGGNINCTSGFHVIEFLLWGEDGNRSINDYVKSNSTNVRRVDFLYYAGINLGSKINSIKYGDQYERALKLMDNQLFKTYFFNNITNFISEDIIQNTIQKPLNSKNRFDELSCFSDNTLENLKSKFSSLKYLINGGSIFQSQPNGETYYFIDMIEELDESKADKVNTSISIIEKQLGDLTGNFHSVVTNQSDKLSIVITELRNIQKVIDDVLILLN